MNNRAGRIVIFIFIFCLSNSMFATEYYVSSSSGNDNNDGLTPQTAWKTISKVKDEQSNFRPGDIIAFKRGDTWNGERYYSSTHPSGSSGNPITYTAYGSGARPILNVHTAQNGLVWTNRGNNIWSTPTSRGRRLFKNGTESLMSQDLSKLGLYGATNWLDTGSRILYVYSTSNPSSDVYSWSPDDFVISFKNTDFIDIIDLDLRGGNSATIKFENGYNHNWNIKNCNIGWNAGSGIIMTGSSTTNILVDNCIFDSNFEVDMSQIPAGGTHVDYRGCSDGIDLRQNVTNMEIKNCFFKNWGHTMFSSNQKDNSKKNSFISVHHNDFTSPDILWGRAFGYSGYFEDSEIYNNYIYEINVQNQIGGSRNHFHHNIIDGVRNSPLKSSPIGVGLKIANGSGTVQIVDNIIENNIVANSDNEGILLHSINASQPGKVTGNIIRNNIVYNCGKQGSDGNDPNIGMQFHEDQAGQGIYGNQMHNNLVYNDESLLTFLYQFNGPINNASDFNNQHANISGNIDGNPLFIDIANGNYNLQAGSPAIDAGITPLSTEDYGGNTIGSNPDIGVYEIVGSGSITANAGPDESVCLGESVTLTASGGSTYLWSTGATTNSISVSPNSTQTYTVTASDSNGNSDSDDVIVTVNSVTANAGSDVTIEEGQNATLNASGGGTYLWNTGATTQSITVNPSTTQTYSVIVTLNGCDDTDEVNVTVNPSTGSVTANAGQDVSICLGDNTTLTASGGSTYLWNTGATTNSISVSPNSTQTYTVTVSDSNGNSDSDDVIVSVNSVSANAGADITIDEGQSTTLNASGGGSYLWSTGATTQSISVSPLSTQTYSVVVTQNGCEDTDDVIVTVNPSTGSVTANAGQDVSICSGESTTLTASGGSTYLWNTGETTNSITVSPNSTQTYVVTASDSNGNSDSDDVIVTVNNVSANAGVDITIDEGQSTTLNASGGGTYLWNTGATTRSITVSPSATQAYSVTVTLNGCEDTDEVIVTVNSSPDSVTADAGEDVTICIEESVELSASGGTSYLWNTGETTSSITVSPTTTTTYSVTVSHGNGIDVDEVTVVVDETCSGISYRLNVKQTKFYPNPTKDVLNIELLNFSNESAISIYDLNGRIVYTEILDNYSPVKIFRHQINLSNFGTGIYFVNLTNSDYREVKKVLVF